MIKELLDDENYMVKSFRFRDRQAGVSVIYDPINDAFSYNAYCLELKLMKELFSSEFEFLADALKYINDEFGTWDLEAFAQDNKGCGNCAAKK